ncbi:MAG: response regulator [Opitutaceae bacterium]|nr:response regulator [Cytophagales bacterium]
MKKFKRVLLVDDELICNYISIKWVKRLEIAENVHVLTNGKVALDFIKENCQKDCTDGERDLVLLDIKMPVMDGFQFLNELENASFQCKDHLKIVLLTSSTSVSDIKEAYKYNIDGYIEKPLNREKIETLINKLG